MIFWPPRWHIVYTVFPRNLSSVNLGRRTLVRASALTAIWQKQTKDLSHKVYEFLVEIPWMSSIKQIDLYIDLPPIFSFILFSTPYDSFIFIKFLLSPCLWHYHVDLRRYKIPGNCFQFHKTKCSTQICKIAKNVLIVIVKRIVLMDKFVLTEMCCWKSMIILENISILHSI